MPSENEGPDRPAAPQDSIVLLCPPTRSRGGALGLLKIDDLFSGV